MGWDDWLAGLELMMRLRSIIRSAKVNPRLGCMAGGPWRASDEEAGPEWVKRLWGWRMGQDSRLGRGAWEMAMGGCLRTQGGDSDANISLRLKTICKSK